MIKRKTLRYGGIVFSLFLLMGCRGSFTSRELKLIKEGEGVMRVWKIDNREDSLFLRQKAEELKPSDVNTEAFRLLKQRMLATVNDSLNPGVGIAAPQVGIGRKLIAVQRYDKPGTPFEFYINPRIEYASEAKSFGEEGCLSVPDQSGKVWRSKEIVVGYIPEMTFIKRTMTRKKIGSTFKFDVKVEYQHEWEWKRDTVRGYTAVIFQHEIDHLEGILFTDKMEKNQ